MPDVPKPAGSSEPVHGPIGFDMTKTSVAGTDKSPENKVKEKA